MSASFYSAGCYWGLAVAATLACTIAPKSEAQEGKRIALVLGNSTYPNITELTNPKSRPS